MKEAKQTAKRVAAGILACATAVSMTACGSKKGKKTTADGKTEITWYCELNGGGNDAMWDTAEVLKKVVEDTGIRPKIVSPAEDGNTKLNLMLSTGDMPDLITFNSTNSSTMDDLINSKALMTLKEIDEKYEKGFLDEIPDLIKVQTKNRSDGELYGLPSMFVTGTGKKNGTQAFNVRADIYEALGSPDMSTPDKFVDALKLFKEKYPTIDGRKTIPLDMNQKCWSLYIIERSFGIVSDNYVDEDGNVKVKWRDPKYRDVVKFMSRLSREGLLDKDMYFKQGNQITEDRATGISFCIPSSFDQLWEVNSVLKRSNDNAFYKVIEPMSAVEDPVFSPIVPYSYWTMTSIPTQANDPETAAKFLRYMWSPEGNTLMNYGIEGKHYTIDDEGYLEVAQDVLDRQANDSDNFMQETGIRAFRFLYYGYHQTRSATEEPQRAADRALASKYAAIVDTNLNRFMEPTKNEPDIQNIKTNMDDIVNSTIHKYTLEADEAKALAALDEMLAEFDRIGVGKLEEFRTEQYKKNEELYGKFVQE